jgi:hypothetical protein
MAVSGGSAYPPASCLGRASYEASVLLGFDAHPSPTVHAQGAMRTAIDARVAPSFGRQGFNLSSDGWAGGGRLGRSALRPQIPESWQALLNEYKRGPDEVPGAVWGTGAD